MIIISSAGRPESSACLEPETFGKQGVLIHWYVETRAFNFRRFKHDLLNITKHLLFISLIPRVRICFTSDYKMQCALMCFYIVTLIFIFRPIIDLLLTPF